MNDRNHPRTEQEPEVGQTPWPVLVFLTAVFFFDGFDLSNVKRGIDNYSPTSDDLIASAIQGSPARQIALLSLGILAIVSLIRYRTNLRLRIQSPMGWLLPSFVVWAFISPIWAEDLPFTLKRLAVFGILCIASVAVVRRLTLREIVLWIFLSTTVCLFIGVLAEILFGTFRPFSVGYRFAGGLYPNNQGTQCGLLLLSAVAVGETEKRWRMPIWVCGLLGFVFLILSASRTALAAVLLALAVYLVAVGSREAKIAMVCSLSVVSCILLLLFTAGLLPSLQNAILLGRNDDPGNADSLSGRTVIWEDLLYYIRQRPILGYGYGGFWSQTRISAISEEIKRGVPDGHSAYIDYLLTLGTVGFVGYTLLLFSGIRRAFRFLRLSQNRTFAFCGALLVFCVLDGLLESSIAEGSFLMFLCMVVLVQLAYDPPDQHLRADSGRRRVVPDRLPAGILHRNSPPSASILTEHSSNPPPASTRC